MGQHTITDPINPATFLVELFVAHPETAPVLNGGTGEYEPQHTLTPVAADYLLGVPDSVSAGEVAAVVAAHDPASALVIQPSAADRLMTLEGGTAAPAGAVVKQNTSTADRVAMLIDAGYPGQVLVALQAIAGGGTGLCRESGFVEIYTTDAVAVGDPLQTSSALGEAEVGTNNPFAYAWDSKGAGAGTVVALLTRDLVQHNHTSATDGGVLTGARLETDTRNAAGTVREQFVGANELSIAIGAAALATTATEGFYLLSSSAGPPTGVPVLATGRVPVHTDTTNGRLYLYIGGAWVYAKFGATGLAAADLPATVMHTDTAQAVAAIKTHSADIIMSGARLMQAGGTTVAAANDLALAGNGNYYIITGATQINRLDATAAGWQHGSTVILKFSSNPLIKYNQAAGSGFFPILLSNAVDFNPVANSTLSLVFDVAGFWYETGRKV